MQMFAQTKWIMFNRSLYIGLLSRTVVVIYQMAKKINSVKSRASKVRIIESKQSLRTFTHCVQETYIQYFLFVQQRILLSCRSSVRGKKLLFLFRYSFWINLVHFAFNIWCLVRKHFKKFIFVYNIVTSTLSRIN